MRRCFSTRLTCHRRLRCGSRAEGVVSTGCGGGRVWWRQGAAEGPRVGQRVWQRVWPRVWPRLTSAAVLLAVRIQRWRSSSLADGRCFASPAQGGAHTRE